MKRRCIVLAATAFLVVAVLVALAAPASAAPAKMDFSATLYQLALSWDTDIHDSGQGNVWHLDNFHGIQWIVSDDPALSGLMYIDGDATVLMKDGVMLQAEWTGKFTFFPTLYPDGIWTGSFTLKNDVTGASTVRAEGIGKAGAVAGWILKFSGSAGYMEPLAVTGYYEEH